MLRFTHLVEVHQQQKIAHTQMGDLLVIIVLVYANNGGSPVKFSIGVKTNIFDSPNNTSSGLAVYNAWFYTPCGSPKND